MNQQPDNDWLDNVLKDEPRYIDDDGFTARVLATLPAKRQRRWIRPVIIGLASLAGIAIAFSVSPPAELVKQSLAWTYYGIPLVPVALGLALLGVSIKAATDEQ